MPTAFLALGLVCFDRFGSRPRQPSDHVAAKIGGISWYGLKDKAYRDWAIRARGLPLGKQPPLPNLMRILSVEIGRRWPQADEVKP